MELKNINLVVLVVLFFGMGCFSRKVISKAIPDNPTSYIFKIKINDARFLLKESLYKNNSFKFRAYDLFYDGGIMKRVWSDDAKKYLDEKGNNNDLWMSISVDSSDIYHDKMGSCKG